MSVGEPQELARNSFGNEWSITFAPECNDPIVSTLPGVLPSIPGSMSRVEVTGPCLSQAVVSWVICH